MRYAVLFAIASTIGCAASTRPSAESFDGIWRARLVSPGGPLPFGLTIDGASAVLLNGVERAPVSSVERRGDELVLHIDWYDAEIRAVRDRDRMRGTWKKRTSTGWSSLPFEATRGEGPRFETNGASSPFDVEGDWQVTFQDEDGPYVARGVFEQDGAIVRGTFLTETGDFRFLEGVYDGGELRLSCFDGAHAFLFVAQAQADGTLAGDFWSRDVYHATWTAKRATGAVLADPYGLATLTNDEGRMHFSFPDARGTMVSPSDERFVGKVLIVDVFGTWCPNCNDQAPVLVDWYRRFRADGLEILGLAYEVTGDRTRDLRQIDVYRRRHSIEFPILLGGTNDKKEAAATLPDLSAVVAYPTTIFIGRDGRVRRIHTGFAGPGTGERHTQLVEEQTQLLRRLLAETNPPPVE